MPERGFVDYYEMFDLDRSMSERELKKALGKASTEITLLEGSTDPNDVKTRQELRETKDIIIEAMRILGKPESRQEYDLKLDAAIKAGTVNREKTQDIQDAIARARKYFEEHKYELALKAAREAVDKHANTEEPHEIIARSLLMLGDYDEALEHADQSADAFQSSASLWWLRIRIAIMMERYDKAQNELNTAIDKFAGSALFSAEQAYLYFHANKDDVGERIIEQYIQQHPDDNNYRRVVAYNLLEIANMYYKYDTNADMYLITEESDYKKCMRIMTLANRFYQDEYIQNELERVKKFGDTEFDDDCRRMRTTYIVLAGLLVVLTLWMSSSGLGEGAGATLFFAALFGIAAFVINKFGNRPYWKIYRDYYRGFKQNDDSFLFTIASMPYDFIRSILGG